MQDLINSIEILKAWIFGKSANHKNSKININSNFNYEVYNKKIFC